MFRGRLGSTASSLVTVRRGLPLYHAISVRSLTMESACRLLGLDSKTTNSVKLDRQILRHAYYQAAKQCHPDAQSSASSQSSSDANALDFLKVTEAYEWLQERLEDTRGNNTTTNPTIDIPYEQEQVFRQACWVQLQLPAEIVEECKRSVEFRKWLAGNTDAAHTWRNFLTQHGGLAPVLPTSNVMAIDVGDSLPKHLSRRKRPRR